MKQLNIGASFKFAFTVYQKNLTLFLTYGTVLFAINAAFFYFQLSRATMFEPIELLNQVAILLLVSLLLVFISSIVQIFYIRLGLKNFENPRTIPFGEIKLASFSLIVRLVVVQLVFVFLVMLGTLLFIIPGIILILCYFFVTEVLVDQDTSSKKVFRISEKLTEGVKWNLLGYIIIISLFALALSVFNLTYYGINFIPLWATYLQLTVSSFIVTPLVSQSSVYLYKDLKKQQEESITMPSSETEKLKLSPCGVDCSTCHLLDKCKKDCNESQGKPFYITDGSIGLDVCDIYGCVRNKKNLKHCGQCEELPCQIYFDWKDPDFTDEEHQEDIKQRVDRLKE